MWQESILTARRWIWTDWVLYDDDKAWMAERIEDFEADLSVLSSLPPFAFINYLRKSVGYDDFLYTYAMDKHLNPEDFNELIDTIQEASKPFDTWRLGFYISRRIQNV